MRYLIISDLHLTDKPDFPRLEYLQQLIANYDQVIINGDFWDSHVCNVEAFVNSSWQVLFPLLKAKQAVYIYGNHDKAQHNGVQVQLFSILQTDRFNLIVNGVTLRIEHGHLLSTPHKKLESLLRTVRFTQWRPPLEKTLVQLKIDWFHRQFMQRNQEKMMAHAQQLAPTDVLVTGHTHLPSFSPEQHFINTGYINHGIAHYLEVDGDHLRFVKEQYAPFHQLLDVTELLPNPIVLNKPELAVATASA